eukprot:TRINITY_DN14023_c0_g1_i7.p1 TRINITY_DN14023_c0_g1~~TRINITY_DN14023_c0_g1_i7.p1  ORF type:complete len:147 (+),score=38.15 TRINITY_DN14023_c0_g1_i7:59-499(+)
MCGSDAVPAPRPSPGGSLQEWLRECSLPMEHRVPGTPGFMLGELLMVDCSSHSEIVPEAIDPLLQWVGFFQGCRMTMSEIGLGMQAITDFSDGASLAQGSVHPGVDDPKSCLLYTSDAADEEDSVDLGGRRIIKKKKKNQQSENRK